MAGLHGPAWWVCGQSPHHWSDSIPAVLTSYFEETLGSGDSAR